MRSIELIAAFAVVICVGLALYAVFLVVRSLLAGAARMSEQAQRVTKAARDPQQLAAGAAGRLARIADPSEIAGLRLRMSLRRTVTGAANAVEAAARAGAPIGDLPAISQRLVTHMRAVEERLALAPETGWGQPASEAYQSAQREAEALIGMAAETHQAAADALAAVTGTTTRALSSEVADVVAGVRAAAAWLRERGTGGHRPAP